MKAYSKQDVYGLGASLTMTTTDQTIPEEDENEYYRDNTTDDTTGLKKVSSGNRVLGAMGLVLGLMVILHFID